MFYLETIQVQPIPKNYRPVLISTGGDGTLAALTIFNECVHYKRKNSCAITKKGMAMILTKKTDSTFLSAVLLKIFQTGWKRIPQYG